MAHPLIRDLQTSLHHPSSTLMFTPPLKQTFIPLVPLASRGRRGVFSQTSVPRVMSAASHMV